MSLPVPILQLSIHSYQPRVVDTVVRRRTEKSAAKLSGVQPSRAIGREYFPRWVSQPMISSRSRLAARAEVARLFEHGRTLPAAQ